MLLSYTQSEHEIQRLGQYMAVKEGMKGHACALL